MVTTQAKAPTPETTPVFIEKFNLTKQNEAVRRLKEQGYTHYLNLRTPSRITVGNLMGEYRILIACAFFKGEVPDLELLKSGASIEVIPVLEQRKYYAEMSSVGRGEAIAELNGKELSEWLSFFEAEPGSIKEIDELIS